MQAIETLKQTIQELIPVDDAELGILLSYARFSQLKKNDLLIGIGEVENQVHFIVEGVTRSFFFAGEKEISFEFYFSGSFISAYASFLSRTPTEHAIEAFTPLTLISVNHEDLMALYAQSRRFEQVGRILTEAQFKKSSDRVKDLLSLSATERYAKLLNAHPQYVQQIPLKYLASYLNITPESLSRIRKTMLEAGR
jgi:CRP-like cAMP-binding protein